MKLLTLFNSNRKQLINFGIYFSANILKKLLPLLLLPVITYYLTPEEYGIWSIYQVMLVFSVPVIGMNMQNNITRNFFNKTRDELAQITSNVLIVLIANIILGLLLIFAYVLVFDQWNNFTAGWLYLVVIYAGANVLLGLDLTVLRNDKRAFAYSLFQLTHTLSIFGITIALVVLYNYGWQGQALGTVIASIIFGIFGVFHLWRNGYVAFHLDKNVIREILVISLPLVPHAVSSVIITMSDRLFIENMIGIDAVGIYSVGYQFGMVLLLVTDSFNLVWGPWIYEQLSSITEQRKQRIVLFTYGYNISVVLFAFLTTLASIFLIKFAIADTYSDATTYVLWVALGYAIRAMYTMVFPYLVYVGKTSFLGIASSIAAVINLIGNYVLISQNGAIGAAQATLLSYLILFLAIWWYAQRIHPMPWSLNWLRRKES